MAYVLTSISGNLISAASAGYAPTNSADISAIASSYQVVSSTSTQLYAGTAFLTEVNDAPVSASRARNAANAGMANSAYYDGTGRLISSLPDSAAVSSIASSYAESAASGKADSSAFGSIDFYGTGYFTGLSGSGFSADWATRAISDANGRYLTNLAAESSLSSKQDTLAFAYDADSAISSINGSALAGGGGGVSITAVSYDTATQQSSTATATGLGIVDSATYHPRVSSVQFTDGQTRPIEANTLAPGAAQTSISYTLLFSPASSMWTTAGAATGIYSPLQYGTGAGLFMDNGNFKGYLKGNELFVCNTGIGQAARVEVHQSRGAHLCLTADKYGIVSANFSPTGVALSNGAQHFTANLDASNNRGAALRLYGGTGSASNSQTSMAWLTPTSLQVSNTASGTAKYAINSIALYDTDTSAQKTISSTSIDYWNGKADSSALSSYMPYSSLEYNTASAISGINGSALAAGSTYSAGEGIDITDDVISVEAPVDIVAGPGIVIDNPDGNTLRVSQAYPTDETVLWDGSTSGSDGNITLSESMTNFERIGIFFSIGSAYEQGTYWYGGKWQFFEAGDLSITKKFCISDNMNNGDSANTLNFKNQSYTVSNDNLTFTLARSTQLYYNGSSWAVSTTAKSKIYKVIGIHRIASN